MKMSRLAAVALLAALALAVGCGDGDEPTTDGSATPSAEVSATDAALIAELSDMRREWSDTGSALAEVCLGSGFNYRRCVEEGPAQVEKIVSSTRVMTGLALAFEDPSLRDGFTDLTKSLVDQSVAIRHVFEAIRRKDFKAASAAQDAYTRKLEATTQIEERLAGVLGDLGIGVSAPSD